MRRNTVVRLILLSLLTFVCVNTTNATTQTCKEECDTAWNQCLATCPWWNFFCVGGCNDQLTYCYTVCDNNTGGPGGPKPVPTPVPTPGRVGN